VGKLIIKEVFKSSFHNFSVALVCYAEEYIKAYFLKNLGSQGAMYSQEETQTVFQAPSNISSLSNSFTIYFQAVFITTTTIFIYGLFSLGGAWGGRVSTKNRHAYNHSIAILQFQQFSI